MPQAIPKFTGVGDGSLILINAPTDLVVFDVVPFGLTRVGIAQKTVLAGEQVNLNIDKIYEFVATDADTFALGVPCYWDATNELATVVAGTNKYIGEAVTEKAPAIIGSIEILLGTKNG